jgi:S-disulfanyl-L-cysteine oxidoreductase SoxD
MRFSNLLAAGIVLLATSASLAQAPSYTNVGRTPTKEEIQAWDIAIGPDGKGLPPGQGTAKEGAPVFAAKCAVCHGAAGQGGGSAIEFSVTFALAKGTTSLIGPRLAGGKADLETLTTVRPVRSIGGYWPYATTVWDFIHRAMPRGQSGTLTANEVYALTAFILAKNEIIKEDDVMDAKTLPKVQMPNRNGFVPARFADIPDEHKRGCTQGLCP